MSGISRAELLKWVNGCIYKGKDGEPLRLFALRHLDANERSTAVEEWVNKAGINVDDLVSDMITTCERDAIGLGHHQQYIFEAYFGNSKTRGRRFTVTIATASMNDDDFGNSEPATTRGEVMQIRRHNENLHRMAIGGASELIRILRVENDDLRAQVKRLMDNHLQVIDTYEKLRSDQHRRNLEIREQEAEIEMRNHAIAAVKPVGLALVQKIMNHDKQLPAAGESAPSESDKLMKDIASLLMNDADRAKKVIEAFQDQPEMISRIAALMTNMG